MTVNCALEGPILVELVAILTCKSFVKIRDRCARANAELSQSIVFRRGIDLPIRRLNGLGEKTPS